MKGRPWSKSLRGKSMRAILGSVCSFVLAAILVAGLWPFNPLPANNVKWLSGGNGIEFRPDGVIFTEEPFNLSASPGGYISLDVWLQPATYDTAPILSFYKRRPREQFRLLQYGDTLLLQMEHEADLTALEIEHVLHAQQSTFVSITFDPQQTSVFVNGKLAKTSSHFIVPPGNLSGRLVAGAQPFDYHSWAGQLRTLAIYHQRLTDTQARGHYQTWTSGNASTDAAPDLDNAIALYRFAEHHGNLVHNAAGSGPALVIPGAYRVLEKKFLEPPWSDTALNWSYFEDIAINVAGFVPLGFFFSAFLDSQRGARLSFTPLTVIALGIAASLTIEILQFYLPTRDSSLTDVITNTTGTAIGVVLFRLKFTQNILSNVIAD